MGGGGPNPDDFNKPTAVEQANTEIAVKHWNDYQSRLKPVVDTYMKDISSDATPRIEKAQGMVKADIMQKVSGTSIDPNRSMSITPISRAAKGLSAADVAVATGAHSQQAAGLQSLIDAGQGKESMAATGMSDLAQQAVNSQIKNAEADYSSNASINRSIMGGAGMAAGMYYNNQVTPRQKGLT